MKYSSLFVVVVFFCLKVYYRLYNFHWLMFVQYIFSHSFTLDLWVCFKQLSVFYISYEWLLKSIKELILVEDVMQGARYFSHSVVPTHFIISQVFFHRSTRYLYHRKFPSDFTFTIGLFILSHQFAYSKAITPLFQLMSVYNTVHGYIWLGQVLFINLLFQNSLFIPHFNKLTENEIV